MTKILDRSKNLSRTKEGQRKKSVEIAVSENPWDQAIAEAKKRIADFKFSIRVFQRKKAEGAPWLGLESAEAGMSKVRNNVTTNASTQN